VISAGASAALLEFAHQTGIPVTTTLLGCGSFPENDPLSLRWLGMHGAAYANWAVDEADLLLAFGVRFDDRVTGRVDKFCQHGFIVHVDIDPSEIGKNKPAHLGLVADLRAFLPALAERLRSRPIRADFRGWRERIASFKERAPFRYHDHPNTLAPQFVVAALYDLTKGEAILTTGVGQHQMWAAQFYRFNSPRRLLTSGGLGAMGFGLPAAIGAKVAFPHREVIDIDGDGSFLMTAHELATAKVEGIAVKAIIINNQHLGMVQQWEDHYCAGVHAHTYLGDPRERDRPYPDFVKLVESFGVACERVTRRDDVKPALQRMLASRDPYVLDIVTPYREHVLPFIPAGGTVADMIY
jgi:acetolactate synthase-1/2/3 large subunit